MPENCCTEQQVGIRLESHFFNVLWLIILELTMMQNSRIFPDVIRSQSVLIDTYTEYLSSGVTTLHTHKVGFQITTGIKARDFRYRHFVKD